MNKVNMLLVLITLSGAALAHGPGIVRTQQHPIQRSSNTNTFIDRSIFGWRSHYDDELNPLSDGLFTAESEYGTLCYGDSALVDNIMFQGIASFAHLPIADCLTDKDLDFDIGIVGAPFDLGVTYRPGARFGPAGARMGSRRLTSTMGYSMAHKYNPFKDWAKVVDCGDIPNTPFDKLEAIKQLQHGSELLLNGKAKDTIKSTQRRIITLGGDHTISLPVIRALRKTWGPVAVLHFDSHLDTWDPRNIGGNVSKYTEINHGSMFHILAHEGALVNNSNMHLGARSMLFDRYDDMENDAQCGFEAILARDIDRIGIDKIVERVVARVGDLPVYVSIDVDSLDPAFAPATGTIEVGGWTTRELMEILRRFAKSGINLVGADVVEFAPVYDNIAETTGIAVAQIVYELLQWMIVVPVQLPK